MDIIQIITAYMDKKDPDEILRLYKECDTNALTSDYDDMNLLHIASRHAHPEAVNYLLECGIDPNITAGNGDTPIFLLAKRTYSGGWQPRKGDIYKTACALLNARAGTLRKDGRDKLCYHYAAEQGNHEFLRAMLDSGHKLTKPDSSGNTGLHMIVDATYNPIRDLDNAKARNAPREQLEQYENKLEDLFLAAAVFTEAGVDADAKNNMLETAHKIAVRRNAKKIAALLEGSYKPGDDNPESIQKLKAGGMTLHQAVRQRDAEAIHAIVQAGADINEISDAEDFSGMTPLAVACSTCNADMAETLLALGADPAVKNGDGCVAAAWMLSSINNLHILRDAISQKTPCRILRSMVEKGFDINSSVTDKGETLLGLACRTGQSGGRDSVLYMITDEALRLRIDVNLADNNGQTPLMSASIGNISDFEEIQVMLLEAGADVGLKDSSGNTALHYAARNSSLRGAFAMAEALFDAAHPDVNAVNNDGKTALEYAVEQNNVQLIKLLLEQV